MLIAFDLDGTLVDSCRDLADSANEMLASYGAGPLSESCIGQLVGNGATALVAAALEVSGARASQNDALARFLAIYDRRLLDHTQPYPGIPGILEGLAEEATLALLTNKPLGASTRILDAFSLTRYFAQCVGGDGRWARKPAPDGFCWLMQQTGEQPATSWLVGDSLIDLQTSRNAGARICLARYGFGFAHVRPQDLDGRECFVDTPEAIPEVVRVSEREARRTDIQGSRRVPPH